MDHAIRLLILSFSIVVQSLIGDMMQQEWREEDEAELRAGLSRVLHRIAVRCAHKDSTVWPQAVSAQMAITVPQPANAVAGTSDRGPDELGDHAPHVDMLAGLGLACWYVHALLCIHQTISRISNVNPWVVLNVEECSNHCSWQSR